MKKYSKWRVFRLRVMSADERASSFGNAQFAVANFVTDAAIGQYGHMTTGVSHTRAIRVD